MASLFLPLKSTLSIASLTLRHLAAAFRSGLLTWGCLVTYYVTCSPAAAAQPARSASAPVAALSASAGATPPGTSPAPHASSTHRPAASSPVSASVAASASASASGSAPTPAPASTATPDADFAALHAQARALFDALPEEIRAQFDFPTAEQWHEAALRLQRALAGDSLSDLAALAADARRTLQTLRSIPGYEELADWLEQRVDAIEGAAQAVAQAMPLPPSPAPPRAPTRPGTPPPPAPPLRLPPVPHYDLWLARVRDRPPPARAAALLPRLRAAFAAEGVPPELVWLAEAESSFNPAARSPVGARGLFQFMPETARAQGLSTFLPDERTDPEKSARAAARYLRYLHRRFGNWALALAAYNAGEGRVARTLAARRASSFTAIAADLPAETRMYVPKVCALVATRAGLAPHAIPPPR